MNSIDINSRRNFLKTGIALGSGTLIHTAGISAANDMISSQAEIKENYTILFQGDSITDGKRTRDNDWNHVMGHGYAYIIACKLWYEFPAKKLHFFNRGISGNKITDLEKRWDTDTIALKPDLLSILIGINDIDAFIRGDRDFGAEQFEEKYQALLQKTRTGFPAIQLVLCDPFILPVGRINNQLDIYSAEVKKRQEVITRLVLQFDAIHVQFQQAFDTALKRAPADYWIWDGIHPMPAGHELMAIEWLKQVSKKIGIKTK